MAWSLLVMIKAKLKKESYDSIDSIDNRHAVRGGVSVFSTAANKRYNRTKDNKWIVSSDDELIIKMK